MELITYIIFIFIILLLVYNFYQNYFILNKIKDSKTNNALNVNNDLLVPCVYDISSLTNMTDASSKCCLLGGVKTGDRIFTVGSHEYLISNSKTSFYIACQSACRDGFLNGNCINGNGQTDLDSCLIDTQPVNCKDTAKPIARKDTDLWYVKSYSIDSCPISKVCSEF
jgi:hypothetical protein